MMGDPLFCGDGVTGNDLMDICGFRVPHGISSHRPPLAHAPHPTRRGSVVLGTNPRSETQTQNHQPDGDAATVAEDVGPDFHDWPSGHILQTTDANALIRIRSSWNRTQKTFGEARAAMNASGFPAPTGRDHAQRPQRQKKKKNRIRNHQPRGKATA